MREKLSPISILTRAYDQVRLETWNAEVELIAEILANARYHLVLHPTRARHSVYRLWERREFSKDRKTMQGGGGN